jgi:hypothetical protein
MTKVRPNVASKAAAAGEAEEASAPVDAGPAEREEKALAVSLMVWRRSLLFNGKGFTVFDCKGNLIYRVETYAGGSSREVVLMDADGHGLLTIRRMVYADVFLCSVSWKQLDLDQLLPFCPSLLVLGKKNCFVD